MSTKPAIRESIDAAADAVGSVWPLHSFVTANPLAGFEDQPFHEAVADAESLLGGDGYPSADVFRQAFESGQIDPDVLGSELRAHGYDADPAETLDRMEAHTTQSADTTTTATERVDAILTKWLAAFLDQGEAEWPMPNREQGFYAAFRTVGPHDSEIPDGETVSSLPREPIDAICDRLDHHAVGEWKDIFEFQLVALPGWTGFIKQRVADDDAWQSTYPITLAGYLAVRLTLVELFDAPLAPEEDEDGENADDVPLPEVWLTAWEASYRGALVDSLTEASAQLEARSTDVRPDAQLVFCIDTRSEVIRRHLEAAGNYETHGYAGFFGVPMRYEGYDSDVTVDACPPIVDAQHRIADRPVETADDEHESYESWHARLGAGKSAMKAVKSNVATAFNFVEGTGAGYGTALTARTLLPGRVYDLLDRTDEAVPDESNFCEPSLDHDPDATAELQAGLALEEKVEIAATAFDLMGWGEFARIVVFTGHGSQTTNNPFDSSLDCGACAGNAGGPNARVLAAICNDEEVKEALAEQDLDIPEDTVFVAAEHNTTTDEVELFDENVPESHSEDIEQLEADLETARAGAAAERVGDGDPESSVREAERRAADWAETRPEWGLAGNAGFVIGPQELTDGLDLDGRSFLHSYDYSTDTGGDALEAIMAGPMVVTQWINMQYYFATVDNAVYGSGSKVTQNPVGNVGVYQGNGGDLMTGLPLQSLMSADEQPYHQPLRLSTVIHAPVDRVTEILAANDEVAELLDNNWLSLTVIDPEQEHRAFHYEDDLEWTTVTTEPELSAEATMDTAVADD